MKRFPPTLLIRVLVILCVVATVGSMILSSSSNVEMTANESVGSAAPPSQSVEEARPDKKLIDEKYGKLPINFEPNLGQTDDAVKFLARGHGYSIFLSQHEAMLTLEKYGRTGKAASRSAVRMTIQGSNETARITGEGLSEGK